MIISVSGLCFGLLLALAIGIALWHAFITNDHE
jgi:hypothetical protein